VLRNLPAHHIRIRAEPLAARVCHHRHRRIGAVVARHKQPGDHPNLASVAGLKIHAHGIGRTRDIREDMIVRAEILVIRIRSFLDVAAGPRSEIVTSVIA
jgi:hypothetical protein